MTEDEDEKKEIPGVIYGYGDLDKERYGGGGPFMGKPLIQQAHMMTMIREIYEKKGWVWPDAQDAFTFAASEAMEALDCILRQKNYVRNHAKPFDGLGKEVAQCILMLLVGCQMSNVDIDREFKKLYEEYVS